MMWKRLITQSRINLPKSSNKLNLSNNNRNIISNGFFTCSKKYSSEELKISKLSQMLVPTQKLVEPNLAKSHELMIKAGLIKQMGSGLYTILPMGQRSLNKLIKIIQSELDSIGCQQLDLPIMTGSELWKKTGRWDEMGSELLKLKDRHEREFCLAPTNEETVTDLISNLVSSYRQLPVKVYQIGKKFRDEMRPRSGLLRSREFFMKDLYTFDLDSEHGLKTYKLINQAYKNIFDKIGVPYKVVEADTGSIGGYLSHEYHFLNEAGEDIIIECQNCGYAANEELAEFIPNLSNISNSDTTKINPANELLSELKLNELINHQYINNLRLMAWMETIPLKKGSVNENNLKYGLTITHNNRDIHNLKVNESLGGGNFINVPIDVIWDSNKNDKEILLILDNSILKSNNNLPLNNIRSFKILKSSINKPKLNDLCLKCNSKLNLNKAIEVAHTFHLGDWFSKPLNSYYQSKLGDKRYFDMGCYGIGITRILSASIECNSIDNQLIWPINLSPYKVIILPLPSNNKSLNSIHLNLIDQFINQLKLFDLPNLSNEIVIDDRYHLSNGFKLNDSQLVGYPLEIRLGKTFFNDNKIELVDRINNNTQLIEIDQLLNLLKGV